MKLKRMVALLTAVMLAFISLSLSACSRGIPSVSDAGEDQNYSLPLIMIVATTEKNRYEEIYSDAIWTAEVENGETFETYLLAQIKEFMRNLKIISLLAENKGIELTNAEKDRIHQLAETYYNGLTEDDISYMGISMEDVEALYQDYYLANKTVDELTKDIDLEVSDSDAKVITVNLIKLSDREQAEAVYQELLEEDSDFVVIAEENMEEDDIEISLGRGEMPEELETAAFSLAEGEISQIVEADGDYYIVQCIDDYDVEATNERKAMIYTGRKNQAFQRICAQFLSENEVLFSDDAWPEISLSSAEKTTTTNFFQLYQESQ